MLNRPCPAAESYQRTILARVDGTYPGLSLLDWGLFLRHLHNSLCNRVYFDVSPKLRENFVESEFGQTRQSFFKCLMSLLAIAKHHNTFLPLRSLVKF